MRMLRTISRLSALVACLFIVVLPAIGQIRIADGLELHGNVRFGYFGQHRSDRNITRVDKHELRLRARVGLAWRPTDFLQFRVRYAWRFTSDEAAFDPGWTTTDVRNNGLRMGQTGFDEAFVRLDFFPGSYLRLGRFQTQYTLPGVIGNGLLRNDSPNTDVQWTDGLMLSHAVAPGMKADIVVQTHFGKWPTNTQRAPLDFSGDGSRVTVFASLERTRRDALLRLVSIDATVSPNALIVRSDERGHYVAIASRTALGWQTESVGDVVWGVEAAYSLVRPYAESMALAGDGRVGGLGLQSTLSFLDFAPGHSIGFAGALVEPALLTSEDYWNNSTMAEVRYSVRLSARVSAQARVRHRADLHRLTTAGRRRAEFITYARITYSL